MFVDDLVSPLRVACVLDPAIDREHTKVREYARTRDPGLVRELAGQSVRWFLLRPLSTMEYATIVEGGTSNAMKLIRAFQFSCIGIENLERPGEQWIPTGRAPTDEGDQRPIVETFETNWLGRRLSNRWLLEIGAVAYERALEGNGLGGGVLYSLPPTSSEGLERMAQQPAAQS